MGLKDESSCLVKRLKEGDEDAFRELIDRYEKRIFNLCYRFLGDYDEAADLTQETFIRVWGGIRGFRAKADIFTWIYRIAINLCKNRRRWFLRRGRTHSLSNSTTLKEVDIPTSELNPEAILEDKEIRLHIQKGIDSLPSKYRLLIILRDIQGLSYEEIARITDSSQIKVKSRLYRARRMLRDRVSPLLRGD